MDISVIICCRKCTPRIQRTLQSIFNQTIKPREIIIVTDTKSSHSFPFVRFVVNEGIGLAAARNTGMKYAKGDVIAFIDDDAVADYNWISGLLSHFYTGNVVVGGPVIPQYMEGNWELSEELHWIIGCTDSKTLRPIGCNFAIRNGMKIAFNENLGKRDGKGLVGEETELINRLESLGYPIIYDGVHPIVYHMIPPERTTLTYIFNRAYNEGVSKAQTGGLSVEKKYAWRMIRSCDLMCWMVLGITGIGYVIGKLGGICNCGKTL